MQIDGDSIAPVIEKMSEKMNEKIDESIKVFFEKNTEIFVNNFEKVVQKTINKNIDATQIINAINKLRADFSTIITEAKLVEQPTDELEKWFNKIVKSVENIRVPSDSITKNNKEFLLEIKKLKDEIFNEINLVCKKNNENDYVEKENDFAKKYEKHLEKTDEKEDAQKVRPTASGGFPACPKCDLDYGHCRCPKIVEEKIDRKILFDYAKDGERSPLHEGGKI